MKKAFLLALIISLFCQVGYSQIANKSGVTVTWGLKIKKTRDVDNIIGSDDNGIYVLKHKKSDLIFEQYNINNLILAKTAIFPLRASDKKENIESIFFMDNEMFLFTSFIDKTTKKNTLLARKIDKSTLSPTSKPVTIGQIDFGESRWGNRGSFDYHISNDQSKLLIYYNLPYKKGEKEKMGYIVFNKNLEKLWEKEASLPYEDQQFKVENYKVDNNGNVYLLGVYFKDKRASKKLGEANYGYKIFTYFDFGEKTDEYDLNFGDKFITDMQFDINVKMDFVCAGFYSEKGSYGMKGTFYMSIDHKTKQIMNKSSKEFSFAEITQNMSAKEMKKAEKRKMKGKKVELDDYDIDDIIMRSDGGALIIAEQYRVDVTTTTTTNAQGFTTTTTHYTYNYNDILVVNISPSGEIDWVQKIVKRQRTTDDGGYFSSYAKIIKGNKIYFIFNDNIKNIINPAEKGVYAFNKSKRKSIASIVELSADGSQTKSALFSSKEAQMMIRPKISGIINDNEMVLFGFWGRGQQIAKLTFN
ncbi:MAG: hypothetical protein WCK02_05685 [Bacteroidota bacterium]